LDWICVKYYTEFIVIICDIFRYNLQLSLGFSNAALSLLRSAIQF
jgi:phage tail protein X